MPKNFVDQGMELDLDLSQWIYQCERAILRLFKMKFANAIHLENVPASHDVFGLLESDVWPEGFR